MISELKFSDSLNQYVDFLIQAQEFSLVSTFEKSQIAKRK